MTLPTATTASIVILCKNGADTLNEVLTSMFAQTVPFTFDVVVVDSGSTDGSLEISRRYPLKLVEIPPHTFNYGTTKNESLAHADGEFIVFVSQDAIPADEHWLHEMIRPMLEDENVAAVYGRQLEHEPCCTYESYLLRAAYGADRVTWTASGSVSGMSFSNACSAIRRALLVTTPFKKLPFAEDRVWAVEVIQQGYTIVYNPRSRVLHSHDFSVREYYRRSVKNASTRRLIDGYRASIRPLFTRYLNPIGTAKLLRSLSQRGAALGLTGSRTLAQLYVFTVAEYLGNLIGSRMRYREFLS